MAHLGIRNVGGGVWVKIDEENATGKERKHILIILFERKEDIKTQEKC